MALPIGALSSSFPSLPAMAPAATAAPAAAGGFGETLLGALERAGGAERNAEQAAMGFASGDPAVGIHEAILAASVAEVQVKFAITLTSRAIEAYRELLSTPV